MQKTHPSLSLAQGRTLEDESAGRIPTLLNVERDLSRRTRDSTILLADACALGVSNNFGMRCQPLKAVALVGAVPSAELDSWRPNSLALVRP